MEDLSKLDRSAITDLLKLKKLLSERAEGVENGHYNFTDVTTRLTKLKLEEDGMLVEENLIDVLVAQLKPDIKRIIKESRIYNKQVNKVKTSLSELIQKISTEEDLTPECAQKITYKIDNLILLLEDEARLNQMRSNLLEAMKSIVREAEFKIGFD